MSIQILPARLANQIAAGEVVERPASVVKELVENSLDAGATQIRIDIEKGGAKRIKIIDNGAGIAKEQLTLALSRHATSKIKDLDDLEGISSLGFRGEALASISSVSRLTLTSKPKSQEAAWQACAQGRDMEVEVQPAAHANGTTIDVKDLFFNTPARRKFLRTDKTEFTHIDELVKRIALARMDVTFILAHNQKIVRQYKAANTDKQLSKRVAQVCGQSFIDNAIEVDYQHDGMLLKGWLAKPSYFRKQNDLCYSYVNGRMMRDKLINHAIRQAYQELLPSEGYAAFVLYLDLDFRDVDVNVHPAKHEVRFHQARYVHDFIYSVCHRALSEQEVLFEEHSIGEVSQNSVAEQNEAVREYIAPLRQSSVSSSQGYRDSYKPIAPKHDQLAHQNYQSLMTVNAIPEEDPSETLENSVVLNAVNEVSDFVYFVEPRYLVFTYQQEMRLIDIFVIAQFTTLTRVMNQWSQGFVSQPLLLPTKLTFTEQEVAKIVSYQTQLQKLGIHFTRLTSTNIKVTQFPAILRENDLSATLTKMIKAVMNVNVERIDENFWQQLMSTLLMKDNYDKAQALALWSELKKSLTHDNFQWLTLNSEKVDLTSTIQALEKKFHEFN